MTTARAGIAMPAVMCSMRWSRLRRSNPIGQTIRSERGRKNDIEQNHLLRQEVINILTALNAMRNGHFGRWDATGV